MKLSLTEIFLLQVVVYAAIWLIDEFVASYVCIILPVILAVILIFALVAELIERSRVPRRFFYILAVSALAPLITGLAFYLLYGGELTWLDQ